MCLRWCLSLYFFCSPGTTHSTQPRDILIPGMMPKPRIYSYVWVVYEVECSSTQTTLHIQESSNKKKTRNYTNKSIDNIHKHTHTHEHEQQGLTSLFGTRKTSTTEHLLCQNDYSAEHTFYVFSFNNSLYLFNTPNIYWYKIFVYHIFQVRDCRKYRR